MTVIKFLLRRRCLRYYIDAGEPEPEKKKGLARIKSLFRPEKDLAALIEQLQKSPELANTLAALLSAQKTTGSSN